MGHSYDMAGRLCCDECGDPGARQRACPARVTYPNGQSLPYCPAADLCPSCYAAEQSSGAWTRAHEYCHQAAKERMAELNGQIGLFR